MNGDTWTGIGLGLCVAWIFYLICAGVEFNQKRKSEEAVCKDRGGVVMDYEGKRICLPETILDIKL